MNSKENPLVTDKMVAHIIPQNDFREHELTGACWCKPTSTLKRGLAHMGENWFSLPGFNHHSADGREENKTRDDQTWGIEVAAASVE